MRNIMDEIALEVSAEISSLRPKGQPTAVPMGQERLSARDYANRVFKMSPEQRQQELQGLSPKEMMALVETFEHNNGEVAPTSKAAPSANT
ncbi:MAG: hypothetical protein IID46_06120, partial [Planctomycetes bacterium]|nr:hypothetical protein [Planctomycetota bacterium]